METETQTPMKAIERLIAIADPITGDGRKIVADARRALVDVEALVKAARAITALFINYRGGCWDVVTIRENSAHHHNLRDALAKFPEARHD